MQKLTLAKEKMVSTSKFLMQSAAFSVLSVLQPDTFATNCEEIQTDRQTDLEINKYYYCISRKLFTCNAG